MKRRVVGPLHRPINLKPAEYLHHAILSQNLPGFLPTQPIVVNGNISIEGGELRHLPPARVTGSVRVKNSPSLASCELKVDGNLEITNCHNLSLLTGSAGSVILDGTGLCSIGADFQCQGDMKVKGSPLLNRLNCRVGQSLFLERGVKASAGPAFYCGVSVVLNPGASLVDAEGKSHCEDPGFPRLLQGARFSPPGYMAPPRGRGF